MLRATARGRWRVNKRAAHVTESLLAALRIARQHGAAQNWKPLRIEWILGRLSEPTELMNPSTRLQPRGFLVYTHSLGRAPSLESARGMRSPREPLGLVGSFSEPARGMRSPREPLGLLGHPWGQRAACALPESLRDLWGRRCSGKVSALPKSPRRSTSAWAHCSP